MTTIDDLIRKYPSHDDLIRKYPSQTDEWFDWYPVRAGALGGDRLVCLKTVWRNRCAGSAIYQEL